MKGKFVKEPFCKHQGKDYECEHLIVKLEHVFKKNKLYCPLDTSGLYLVESLVKDGIYTLRHRSCRLYEAVKGLNKYFVLTLDKHLVFPLDKYVLKEKENAYLLSYKERLLIDGDEIKLFEE